MSACTGRLQNTKIRKRYHMGHQWTATRDHDNYPWLCMATYGKCSYQFFKRRFDSPHAPTKMLLKKKGSTPPQDFFGTPTCPPFHCFGSEMPSSCSPKVKAIQSRVRKQNNYPYFGNKSTSSRMPTEKESRVSIYTFSIKHGLRTADCGLGLKRGLIITDWV